MKNLILQKEIDYNDLDKHFKAPKNFETKPFFTYTKFPRKLKKSLKAKKSKENLNVLMWYLMDINYKRFIIKKLCEHYNK